MGTRRQAAFRRLASLMVAAAVLAAGLQSRLPARSAAAASAGLAYRLVPAMTSSVGADQRGLVADGSLVVWQDSRGGNPDIFGYDLADNREFRVARAAAYRSEPAISGSTLVWVTGSNPRQRTIQGIDLDTNVPITVTTDPAEVAGPAVGTNVVVWRQRDGGRWTLRGRNLSTGQAFQIPTDALNVAHPSIHGASVVFQGYRDGNWDLFRYDLGAASAQPLTTTPADETDPVAGDGVVLFRRTRPTGGPPDLVLRNLATGTERTVVSGHLVLNAALAGGVAVWEDWRTGLPDVYAYDVAHDQIFAVARSQQATDPAVSTRGIAWVSGADPGHSRVQGVALVQRLPTDPQDPPAVPSPNAVYVPETQHFISLGFKNYWQAHGGPDVFGYPLTEEYTEKDPANGQDVIVQYFQRVKMEYRASAPDGQRVSLARLGADLTADRRFPPVPAVPDSPDRGYFAATGHTVAFGFKEFWDAHGGLATFGYPISEEFTENGRTVQYFERARFEFNPDAKDGQSKVTLGLLGQEALQEKGWLPPPPVDTTSLLD